MLMTSCCPFTFRHLALQSFELVTNQWITNALTERSESSVTLLLWPIKMITSQTVGLPLGPLFTAVKGNWWTKREEEVGKMENGEDPAVGSVVRDLIGWKQFSCWGRCICIYPLLGATCTSPDWLESCHTIQLCLVLSEYLMICRVSEGVLIIMSKIKVSPLLN